MSKRITRSDFAVRADCVLGRVRLLPAAAALTAVSLFLVAGALAAPPTGRIEAFLVAPDTRYRANVVGDEPLSYDWSETTISCGTFGVDVFNPALATWHHPDESQDEDGCPHEQGFDHPGTIVVKVSDSAGNVVRCVYEGSLTGTGDDCAAVAEEPPPDEEPPPPPPEEAPKLPDLVVEKLNDTGGVEDEPDSRGRFGWAWTVRVTNAGDASALFPPGSRILVDSLPAFPLGHVGYEIFSRSDSGASCRVRPVIFTWALECVAELEVLIPSGESFEVILLVGVRATGTYTNPASGADCLADPDNVVEESAEDNNACHADTVTVIGRPLPPASPIPPKKPNLIAVKENDTFDGFARKTWTWSIRVVNDGDAVAGFLGSRILLDDLPAGPGLTYGQPRVTSFGQPGLAERVQCFLAGTKLFCQPRLHVVEIPSDHSFTVAVEVTAADPGTYTNPAPTGRCAVDPDNVIDEHDEGDNTCGPNAVTVTG